MLSLLQKKAFHALRVGFFFLYAHPVEWDLTKSKILLNKTSSTRWFMFGYMLALNILLTAGYVYVPMTHLLISKRPNFLLIHVGLYVLGSTFTSATMYFTVVFARQISVIQSINQFLELQQRLSTGKILIKNINVWILACKNKLQFVHAFQNFDLQKKSINGIMRFCLVPLWHVFPQLLSSFWLLLIISTRFILCLRIYCQIRLPDPWKQMWCPLYYAL